MTSVAPSSVCAVRSLDEDGLVSRLEFTPAPLLRNDDERTVCKRDVPALLLETIDILLVPISICVPVGERVIRFSRVARF